MHGLDLAGRPGQAGSAANQAMLQDVYASHVRLHCNMPKDDAAYPGHSSLYVLQNLSRSMQWNGNFFGNLTLSMKLGYCIKQAVHSQ